ncbi:hypothetical protein NL676_022337 [Syzygium grande]|nr:hypothetical protein NL676_022337 [Syzygium grande]
MSTLKVYLPITVFFILSLLSNLIATTTPRGRLQATRSTSQGAPYPDLRKMFDLAVAKDGSGNFTSINDAVLAAAPSNSKTSSDKSAFFQCSFLGYQDTLNVHVGHQFYRDCDIYERVDFVFGDAAVAFQNCNLFGRKPDEKQKNVFTAQGRDKLKVVTGMSFLGCNFTAAPDLIPVQSSFQTFLGRPWKEFSTTVIMQSYIDDPIDPAGWLEYNGMVGLNMLYYGEYQNRGPGSNTSGRVKWAGYHVISNSTVARQFTVDSFIQGSQWLNNTGFPYYPGLD